MNLPKQLGLKRHRQSGFHATGPVGRHWKRLQKKRCKRAIKRRARAVWRAELKDGVLG